MARDLNKLVAPMGAAPRVGQYTAPHDLYSSKPPVHAGDDFHRVYALPRRVRPVEGSAQADLLIREMCDKYGKASRFCACAKISPRNDGSRSCIDTPKLVQAWALQELSQMRGLLGNIGVGSGKTLLNILAPLAVPCKIAVVLLPSSVADQTIQEYQLLSQHWRVPSLVNHGTTQFSNLVPGMPVLHILPYSRLQLPQYSDWLRQMQPDLIIADECHKMKNANTASTSRFLNYFKHFPDTIFCGWTGSLTESSLEDYAHLAKLALRDNSPVPLLREVVAEWSNALCPGTNPADPGALLKFCKPGQSAIAGFHDRFTQTRGIITTTTASVSVPLIISERLAPEIPTQLAEMLEDLRKTWTRPDGEELIDALALARCARELACGIFNRWEFPRGESPNLIEAWMLARQTWNKELRQKLFTRTENMDSEFNCTQAAIRFWGSTQKTTRKSKKSKKSIEITWKAISWPAWFEIKDKVKPVSRPVRVDSYLVEDAADWSHKNTGIVWYSIDDFGSWLAQVSGLQKHGGGAQAPAKIKQERGNRSIIASIKSHGTGRNGLQYYFDKQLVAQPPSSNKEWEQMLGRLHRHGQTSSVSTEFYMHTPELKKHVDSALEKALYVENTMGASQKLIVGYQEQTTETEKGQ